MPSELPQDRIVLCHPKATLKCPDPTAETDWCETCREPIWIHPRTRDFATEQPLRLLCMSCGERLWRQDPDKVILDLMPGQAIDVLFNYFARRAASGEGPPVRGL